MKAIVLVVSLVIMFATPTAAARPVVGNVEVDLRWMTACPGPWGHEERNTVGPVTIVTYECDDGGT